MKSKKRDSDSIFWILLVLVVVIIFFNSYFDLFGFGRTGNTIFAIIVGLIAVLIYKSSSHKTS